MIFSEPRSEVVAAVVKATGVMTDMTKTQTAKIPTKSGGQYTYTYVDLAEVMEYVRPLLAKEGLAVSQETLTHEGGTAVSTTLLHTSGQWMSTAPLKLPSATDAQSHGSAITYARRYSLMAILGLATEDDDGLAASPSRRPASQGEDVPSGTAPEGTPVATALAALPQKKRVEVQKAAAKVGITDVHKPEHADVVLGLIKEHS